MTTQSQLQLNTEAEVRDFLKLCLDPGPLRPKRTVAKLARVMPGWLRERLDTHAPDLAELHATAGRLQGEADRADRDYAKALGAWIGQQDGEAS